MIKALEKKKNRQRNTETRTDRQTYIKGATLGANIHRND
jgi:hypothetical protein